MNPRVSRSSALASKATGFPIAKVAARLAVGYTLDELMNDITGATPASFEPTIDYVVTKIPRFAFEKYPGAEPYLTTSMKSVGEVMAIGRTFAESLQKALRGLETGLTGLDEIEIAGRRRSGDRPRGGAARAGRADARPAARHRPGVPPRADGRGDRRRPAPTSPGSCARSRPWWPRRRSCAPTACRPTRRALRRLKAHGLFRRAPGRADRPDRGARCARRATRLGVRPVFKRIDTCAGRVRAPRRPTCTRPTRPARSARRRECESEPSDRKKAIILGGGPNRIGQGIEFDYCCCHAAFALDEIGVESIMVNCNPETVSTDYDTSDRLYFEPLTAEDVLELIAVEQSKRRAARRDRPVRRPDAAEAGPAAGGRRRADPGHLARRHRPGRGPRALPGACCTGSSIAQPVNAIARSAEEAFEGARRVGYPGGDPALLRAGRPGHGDRPRRGAARRATSATPVQVSGDSPVLIDQYLSPRHRGGRRRPVRRRGRCSSPG